MQYKTTLAQVAAKWMPDLRLGESRAVHALTDEKRASLDLSPDGLRTMIQNVDAALLSEQNPYRRKVIKAARNGLNELASGAPAPSNWAPIWDVFCYWPAAEEVIQKRPPPDPEWINLTPAERLRRAVSPKSRKPHFYP